MADATAARNARLDALVAAAQQWATSQTQALNNEVTTLQTILQGRSGAQNVASSTVSATSDLVVSSINDFLTG